MSAITASPSKHEPLTPAVFHILLALAVTERHGYAIMKQAETDSAGAVKMGPGTLYGTIKRLVEAGHVEEAGDQIDPSIDGQRRRYYKITPDGRALLGLELERLEHIVASARKQHLLPNHHLQVGHAA